MIIRDHIAVSFLLSDNKGRPRIPERLFLDAQASLAPGLRIFLKFIYKVYGVKPVYKFCQNFVYSGGLEGNKKKAFLW